MELTVRITFGPRIAHADEKTREHNLRENRISTLNVILTLLDLACNVECGLCRISAALLNQE
jgi:hypothetical protein